VLPNKRRERSEQVCARYQEAGLPQALPVVSGFVFDGCYRCGPSEGALGGDWYDAMRLADGRIVISIGDVGGSGLSAAIIMATLRQVIRGVAYIQPDPVMIVEALDKALRDQYADTYVSAFVGVIDPVEMTMLYVGAGHPPPLLRRSDGAVEELGFDGLLLGIPAPVSRTPELVQLAPGSLLVLYTDGLIEATRDVLSGAEKLRAAVAGLPKGVIAPATAIHDRVLLEPAHDDVAVLTVEVQPSPFGRLATTSGDGVSRWTFEAANAGEAQSARAHFSAQLRAAGAADEDLLSAEIVFGELVGNVVRHAPGSVDALVDWTGPAPVLHVRDSGRGFTFVPRLPRDVFAESGRGLYIIAALTDDFNVSRGDDGGSHARAVISETRRRLPCRATVQTKSDACIRGET
jgi:anti-sigma regulatory factor (Ser/Thr protein kinase)